LGLNIFQQLSKEDKALISILKTILGFKPKHIPFYIAALTHRSANDSIITNNERLEFLGDAFIGSIVGEYLFKKYPTQNEGFLTEMRSKIVSRQSLNDIAVKMGLPKIVRYNIQDKVLKRSHIFGNALEALVGAIYLDRGFDYTKKFIYQNLLSNYVDIDTLEVTDYNFKNKFYTWAQKHNYKVNYETIHESFQAGRKVFEVGLFIEDKLCFKTSGYSKKEASQRVSSMALEHIETFPDYVPKAISDDSLFESKKAANTSDRQSDLVTDTKQSSEIIAEQENTTLPTPHNKENNSEDIQINQNTKKEEL